MANVFQPQVAEINSAVTPQEVAPGMSGAQLFADVAKVATEAAFSFTGQRELTDLGSKFDRVAQARESGGNATSLQVKARADLDAAKANSPWIAEQADKLWRDKFGGGSGGTGIFKATPQEAQAAKDMADLQSFSAQRNISLEEGSKRMALNKHAEDTKLQVQAQKDAREFNSEALFFNTQAQINNQTVKMMDAVNNLMVGGTLSGEDLRSVELTTNQVALQLKQDLNSLAKDPETGHLVIDQDGYEANLKEIEDWAAETKAMAKDNSYLKVIQDVNSGQSAEINHVATKKYRLIKEIEAGLGQAGVKEFMAIALRPEGTAKDLLIKRSPFAKELFKQQGSFKQAASQGYEKVMLPTPANVHMTQAEAIATGSILNDPRNSKIMLGVVEKVATEPEATAPVKSMIKQDSDSSAFLWSERFKGWAKVNQSKAKDVLDVGVDSLKKAFLSSYVSETGKLPSDFEIKDTVRETETRRTKGGSVQVPSNRRGSLKRNVVVGEGMTKETGKILSSMLSILIQNPQYAEKVANDLGTPDDTPHQLVRSMVLGVDLTADDRAFMEGQKGEGTSKATALPADTTASFNALEDSSPEEIQSFQAALRQAKTPTEKAEVHAAFIDGNFRRAG